MFFKKPQAPIITRATFLLECAHFIHLCNRGSWPTWMKQTLPSFRPSGPMSGNRASIVSGGQRRVHILQNAAGKMFHSWAESLGMRLEDMITKERATFDQVTLSLSDIEKQKQLLQQDEEEDFLDECKLRNNNILEIDTLTKNIIVSVNPHGNDCPPALKLVACVVLMEATAFLRETYPSLPKSSRLSHKEKPAPWDKVYREANRRWSMALSSMGHSQTSAQSLQSIAGAEGLIL